MTLRRALSLPRRGRGADEGRREALRLLILPRIPCGLFERLKKIFWMLLDGRIIERTELKPNSRLQKYRLTEKGRKLVASFKKKGGRK